MLFLSSWKVPKFVNTKKHWFVIIWYSKSLSGRFFFSRHPSLFDDKKKRLKLFVAPLSFLVAPTGVAKHCLPDTALNERTSNAETNYIERNKITIQWALNFHVAICFRLLSQFFFENFFLYLCPRSISTLTA